MCIALALLHRRQVQQTTWGCRGNRLNFLGSWRAYGRPMDVDKGKTYKMMYLRFGPGPVLCRRTRGWKRLMELAKGAGTYAEVLGMG